MATAQADDPIAPLLVLLQSDFFSGSVKWSSQGKGVFTYLGPGDIHLYEALDGNHLAAPSTRGIWRAGGTEPFQVRHLFLFYSPVEAVCFAYHKPSWIANPLQVTFAALGQQPSQNQFAALRSSFPLARLHCVFGNDLLGKVNDCRIAFWSRKCQALFRYHDGKILITEKERQYCLPEDLLSLSRVEKATGLRSGCRTHKPKAGHVSFHHQYLATYDT